MASRNKAQGQRWDVLLGCKRRGLNVNADNSKMMERIREEGLECEVRGVGMIGICQNFNT